MSEGIGLGEGDSKSVGSASSWADELAAPITFGLITTQRAFLVPKTEHAKPSFVDLRCCLQVNVWGTKCFSSY